MRWMLVVYPDVDVIDPIPSVIVDTKVTTPSTEPFVHTEGGFLGGPVDRSVLTEYANHMALRLRKREVYVFYCVMKANCKCFLYLFVIRPSHTRGDFARFEAEGLPEDFDA